MQSLIYTCTFLKKKITFYAYITDLIIFNCNNFEEIPDEIYPSDLILIRIDRKINILFLGLKMNKNSNRHFLI